MLAKGVLQPALWNEWVVINITWFPFTFLPGGTCAAPVSGYCQHNCTDVVPGPGYVCSCRPGYERSQTNSHYCDDINECAIFGKCSQKCENFKGGYKCSCYEGYQLSYAKSIAVCKIKGKRGSLLFVLTLKVQYTIYQGWDINHREINHFIGYSRFLSKFQLKLFR
jgi:hypothetical protein